MKDVFARLGSDFLSTIVFLVLYLATGDVIELVVELADHKLRVEVHDPGGGFVPSSPSPDPARPSGWGLYLVAELADRWGVDSEEETLVWFELDRRAAAA